MKKRLVFEYWSNKETGLSIPAQYSLSFQKWLCEILYQTTDGEITEFEIKPDKKMLLKDLLPYIKEQMNELVPEDAVDCGFRLYRSK
tara:strand:- start:270 stop:530 length:261 start_codon:yes stop_codon:yes gene_type:complete